MAVAACAAAPPLDDAAPIAVELASTDDLARYAQARDIWSREMFGGASFSDGKGHVLVQFSAAEYDEYLDYLREDRPEDPVLKPRTYPYEWPVVRVAFQSPRILFDPNAGPMPSLFFYLCDSDGDSGRLWGFRDSDVMWNGRIVTSERALEIKSLLEAKAEPQEYEVFLRYVFWDLEQAPREGQPITLLPLPDDLCIALQRSNYPLPSSEGRPMRISRNAINTAVGPLPRPLSAAGEISN